MASSASGLRVGGRNGYTGERRGQEEGEGAGMGSARQHWELEEDADTGQVGNCGAVPRTRSQLGLETMVSLKGSRSAGA